MTEEENKTITHRFFEKVWNQGNADAMDEFVTNDIAVHSGSRDIRGLDGYKKYILGYRNAFPDAKFTIEDQIAEGEKVVDRFTVSGTHKGELQGIPPTDKEMEVKGIGIFQIENNKIVEVWGVFDLQGLMRQIGAVPPPKQPK